MRPRRSTFNSMPTRVMALCVALLALVWPLELRSEGSHTTSAPQVFAPGYYRAKTWKETGEQFVGDWRRKVNPGSTVSALLEMLPKPQVEERVNSDVWLVWEYVRREGTTQTIAFGPTFESSTESGSRLRVRVDGETVLEWTYYKWTPGERLHEDSSWYFSPEQVSRRERERARQEEKLEKGEPTFEMKVDFDEAFDE